MLKTIQTYKAPNRRKRVYYTNKKRDVRKLQTVPTRTKPFTLKACAATATTLEAERSLQSAASILLDLTTHLDYAKTAT
jgi:hypothetical protein